MYYITIDTGTTNTRVCAWRGLEFIGAAKREVGVRDTSIDGSNQKIKTGIAEAYNEVLQKNDITDNDISVILASGMITSNLGLVEVPHLIAPADIGNFAEHIQKHTVSEISAKQIHFIAGLKNFANAKPEEWEASDVMRGEEVETLAILKLLRIDSAITLVLPGSHTKFVAVDAQQKLIGCCTTLAGELTSVVTNNTILTNSLNASFASELDNEYVLKGAFAVHTVGLTRSLFSIRVLEQTQNVTQNQMANFLLGIIAYSDMQAMLNSQALKFDKTNKVGIYGDSLVAKAFMLVLEIYHPYVVSIAIKSSIVENLSGYGCLLVAKQAKLI